MANFMQIFRILFFVGLFLSACQSVMAQPSSVSLLQAGLEQRGTYLLGIHVKLEPGWMTYWRLPGEAGISPKLVSEGSENLQKIRMDFPAPKLLHENGFTVLGYDGDVIFPIHIAAKDPTRPVTLRLTLHYGACKEICLPETGSFEERLEKKTNSENLSLIGKALARVPQPDKSLFGQLSISKKLPLSLDLKLNKSVPYNFVILEVENKAILSIAEPQLVGSVKQFSFSLPADSLQPEKDFIRLTAVAENKAATAEQIFNSKRNEKRKEQ
jgi:DsbC/DsbD-like thiol-disulfide interchange protein